MRELSRLAWGGVALLAVLFGLLVGLLPSARAEDTPIGIILADAGTATTSWQTPTPFTVPKGSDVSVQCTATAWVQSFQNDGGVVNRGDAVAGMGVKIAADRLYDLDIVYGYTPYHPMIGVICDTADYCQCRVFQHREGK